MATPAERNALLFLAALAILGAGVRVAGSLHAAPADDPASRRALRTQISAVDSASARASRSGGARPRVAVPHIAPPPPLVLTTPRDAPYGVPSVHPDGGMNSGPTVDVDRATESELERLPRIGPALAHRIVENRDSLGTFGSLEQLQRVKGIGPAMAIALAPRVTFSGTISPSTVAAKRSSASAADGQKKRQRPLGDRSEY